ncbi:two-component regulator propeller domain-containing protein [Maribacter sp. TH_r10]|uniref:two-component regulator propeller domain-containing protein n=1 Tax=Maribacter sp. TH_r10 TaxID=3082086 RepID=UPI002954F9DD|nr:two-component regulator propeller domain-containing protein [Maribacter sp. TH_r10]MDV7138383.1 two-component regulator propeller domain-containing protein [Maribacter sp. TH_r10]
MIFNSHIYRHLIFYFFFTLQIWGQGGFKEFNFVNLKDGISKVAVPSITQDKDGFIWIGTNGAGLYRFDGADYLSYKHILNDSTSLISNIIYCSHLDYENRLWIGTEDGLNLYDRQYDRFKKIPINRINKIKNVSVAVSSLGSDKSGNIFIGTFENGLYKFNVDSEIIEQIPIDGVNSELSYININGIQVSDKGKVYAGSNIGLLEYDSITNTLKKCFYSSKQGIVSIDESIQSLFLDNSNNIWVGTLENGLYRASISNSGNQESFSLNHYEITNKRILSMIQIPDGTLLIGTENAGLIHLNQNGSVIKKYTLDKTDKDSIKSNSIWSLFVDKNERIWMGYYNSGVAVYDKLYDKFNSLESVPGNPNSLQFSSVTAIEQDENGNYWISMDGGGIDIYHPKTNKFDHINKASANGYSGLTSLDIQTLFIDSKKNIWAGSWNNGLFLLKNGSKKFINYNSENTPNLDANSILSIDEDSDGIIWIGTFHGGVVRYDPENEDFVNQYMPPFPKNQLIGNAVRKVLVDSKNNVWVGTTEGVFRINNDRKTEFQVDFVSNKEANGNRNKKSANHILSLYESSDGSIWFGTRGSGLCRYTEERKFQWYNELYEFTEESISNIIEDKEGNLWVTVNSGLSKLNLKNNEITNFTLNDGLLSNEFNFNAVYRDKRGYLYFGNYKGVDFFNPEDISLNKIVPKLYLTGLKLFNQEVLPAKKGSPLKEVLAETEEIELNHNQSVFTIEYSGISYTRPEKNQYAYYLEGLEESWNYVGGLRSATYTNLDKGTYVFKLKAANNDGVWNDEPLELKIIVLPPWWKTNWALLLYVLMFFGASYVLNLVAQRRIKEKELLRNERIQRIQEDELHEKKTQFFTNISHEFRTPLTLMINPLQDIIYDEKLKLPERVKEKHNVIYKNAYRLYRLINELMDFRKLELNKMTIKAQELNLVNFTKEIISYFKEEASKRNIHLVIDADVPIIPLWADQSMLEKIIFNILSNAMKVTPDGGAINIDILSKDDLCILPLVDEAKPVKVVEIIISDTGPGLEKNQINKIFERFYQVENLNKTYYGGTGIGLEVVQNFVRLHKGKIEVESELGEGSTFRVLLPAGKNHFVENEIFSEVTTAIPLKDMYVSVTGSEPSGDDISLEEKALKPNTVLIVEDNIELRDYLKNELKKHYEVLVANNGKEGLEKAREVIPDAIMTDVLMPEMNGFDFCRIIKTDIRTSHIPLLMLTAKTRIEDRIEGIGYGADAYMVKPFDMRLLKLRLSQLITSRKLIFDKYFGEISGTKDYENSTSIDKEFIEKVLSYINENMDDTDLSVESLAVELNLSRSQLYRKIKTLTGQTVNEFLRKIRLQRAKKLLESGSVTVGEVCCKVGFSSPSYFTKCFKAYFGILPTDIESNTK